jgi:hypothetical protein
MMVNAVAAKRVSCRSLAVMKLAHLLLMTFGTSGLCFCFAWLLSFAGLQLSFGARYWLTFPIAFFVALLLAWPVSRLFGLSPLMIFAGPCPGCHTRPSGWWATESGKVRLVLTCGSCGEQSELWLTRRPPADLVSPTRRTFRLGWPEFLGIWHEVQPQHSTGRDGPA